MVSLTFYGGIREIGGNKILLEDGKTRVLIDFGVSFSRRSLFYNEFLNPRASNGLGDFLQTGLIPSLKGVYRNDLLQIMGRDRQEPSVDGVLLSHAHMDHASYISFLHEKIPVYCGETCKLALQAVQEASGRNMETEITEFRCRDPSQTMVKREIRTFRTGREFSVGSIAVEPVHVDHSIPGDYGFIIRTSAGPVVYTSDFRMHGTHPEMTREFVERARSSQPVAVITEGTRINEAKDDRTETKVKAACLKFVEEARSLVVTDFNLKDVDRLRTFLEVAKQTGRKLLVTLKGAHILKYWHKDPKLGIPGPDDKDILVMLPKRMSGTYHETDYHMSSRDFLKQNNLVRSVDVGSRAPEVIACMGFYDMGEILDARPEPGSLYLYSSSEPHSEEAEYNMERLKRWVNHLKLEWKESHASGHAAGDEIKEVLSLVSPRQIYPIHTEKPELFSESFPQTVIVEAGRSYEISS